MKGDQENFAGIVCMASWATGRGSQHGHTQRHTVIAVLQLRRLVKGGGVGEECLATVQAAGRQWR